MNKSLVIWLLILLFLKGILSNSEDEETPRKPVDTTDVNPAQFDKQY